MFIIYGIRTAFVTLWTFAYRGVTTGSAWLAHTFTHPTLGALLITASAMVTAALMIAGTVALAERQRGQS